LTFDLFIVKWDSDLNRIFINRFAAQRLSVSPCLYVLHVIYVFTRTWLRYVRVLAIANPSVVVCLSVTFVHPIQLVEIFAMFICHFIPQTSADLQAELYEDCPSGTPPSKVKRERGSQI